MSDLKMLPIMKKRIFLNTRRLSTLDQFFSATQ